MPPLLHEAHVSYSVWHKVSDLKTLQKIFTQPTVSAQWIFSSTSGPAQHAASYMWVYCSEEACAFVPYPADYTHEDHKWKKELSIQFVLSNWDPQTEIGGPI